MVILIVNGQIVGTVCAGCARQFLSGLVSRADVWIYDRGGNHKLFSGGKSAAVAWLDGHINRESVRLVGAS